MPVTRDSYVKRIDTLRSRLSSLHADAAFATPSSNLFYLSGIDFHRSERLTALFVFKDRDPVVVCPSGEGTFAVEPSTAYDDVERLLKARSGWKAVSAAPVFAALRMVKTAEE